MEISRHHLFTGPRLPRNQYTYILVGHLLHQLAHRLYRSTRADKAAEKLKTTLLAPFTRTCKLIPVDLGTVERVHKLGIVERPFHAGDHPADLVVGQAGQIGVTNQQQGHALRSRTHLGNNGGHAVILAVDDGNGNGFHIVGVTAAQQ